MLPDEELIKKKLMKLIKVSFKSRQPDVMAVKCLDASIERVMRGIMENAIIKLKVSADLSITSRELITL